jgi:UDP-N-acetylmuramoyl-tripeptide--D-alanyl-D-alanine ligase
MHTSDFARKSNWSNNTRMCTTEQLYKLLTEDRFSISTDTRTITPGDIYIGIKGDVFDGNIFAPQALEKGARYAIVDDPTYATDERYILVSNTRQTLEELATYHRKQFSIPILVIGGSNGKTTTKELVHAVLSKKYTAHVTKGNLNNDLGVPLTILAMPRNTQIAIIEIGANHPGEHITLMNIVAPTHVLVTNNGADHLEGFGSLAGVRSANKEIYGWMRDHEGHIFVNKNITDLVEDSADTKCTLYPQKEVETISGLYAGIRYSEETFISSLFGSYNEPNILAAIAVGEYFEVPLSDIKDAIASYVPTLKRSQVIQGPDYSIILDCYNANPSSMEAALRDFVKDTTPGKRVFIIGDMFEMGSEEDRVHKEILTLVQSLVDTNDTVMCVGPRFGKYKNECSFSFFETTDSAREVFNALNLSDKFIFLKASRGIRLEEVIKEKVSM